MDLSPEVTGRINTKCLFFLGNSGLENKLGVSKNLLGEISLSIISLNSFAIAAPYENKKFQKFYCDFNNFKLQELVGCFIPFNQTHYKSASIPTL